MLHEGNPAMDIRAFASTSSGLSEFCSVVGVLDELDPTEAAGITVEGDNKWLMIIQNASKEDIRRLVS